MKIDWTFTVSQPWTLERVLDFVSRSHRYNCQVRLAVNGIEWNAKGIVSIVSLSLFLEHQSAVTLLLEGTDAQEAFEGLSVFLQCGDIQDYKAYSRSS